MTRTTVRLDDALMDQVRREAEKRGETLTSLIELGLRLVLAQSSKPEPRKRVELPISRHRSGVRPGVDLTNNVSMFEAEEEGLPLIKLR
jgi:hypothetical protein